MQEEEDKYEDSDKDWYCYNPAAGGGGIVQRGVEGLRPILRLELPSPRGPKHYCSSYFLNSFFPHFDCFFCISHSGDLSSDRQVMYYFQKLH